MPPMSPFEELTASLEKATDWTGLEQVLQEAEAAYQRADIGQSQAESLALTAATLGRNMANQGHLERLAA